MWYNVRQKVVLMTACCVHSWHSMMAMFNSNGFIIQNAIRRTKHQSTITVPLQWYIHRKLPKALGRLPFKLKFGILQITLFQSAEFNGKHVLKVGERMWKIRLHETSLLGEFVLLFQKNVVYSPCKLDASDIKNFMEFLWAGCTPHFRYRTPAKVNKFI